MTDGGKGVVAPLTAALKDNVPTPVRVAAAYALADVGPAAAEAVPALIPLLSHEASGQDIAAATALGRSARREAGGPGVDRNAAPAVVADPRTRRLMRWARSGRTQETRSTRWRRR